MVGVTTLLFLLSSSPRSFISEGSNDDDDTLPSRANKGDLIYFYQGESGICWDIGHGPVLDTLATTLVESVKVAFTCPQEVQ